MFRGIVVLFATVAFSMSVTSALAEKTIGQALSGGGGGKAEPWDVWADPPFFGSGGGCDYWWDKCNNAIDDQDQCFFENGFGVGDPPAYPYPGDDCWDEYQEASASCFIAISHCGDQGM
jgi:hypothetical protein